MKKHKLLCLLKPQNVQIELQVPLQFPGEAGLGSEFCSTLLALGRKSTWVLMLEASQLPIIFCNFGTDQDF